MTTDLVRLRPDEYVTPREPEWVDLARSKLLTVDGRGAPGGKEFRNRLQALYAVAYGTVFDAKKRGRPFRVAPLEGVWWIRGSKAGRLLAWPTARWRLQVPVPDHVDKSQVDRIKQAALAKGKTANVARVELEYRPPERCVQLLHVGPYSDEQRDLARMKAFARESGARVAPHHVEVYLSDPRRVPPARLRTSLRETIEERPSEPHGARPQHTTRVRRVCGRRP